MELSMPTLKSRLCAALLFTLVPAGLGAVATPVLAGVPGSTGAVNVDAQGLGLRGYDPVAYFDSGKPTRGSEAISASFGGARYLFASEAHRKTFLASPETYVPAFGGFCTVGASFGSKVDADPETGKVVDGKLYVNFSDRAQGVFDKDPDGVIGRAHENWATVKDKAF